MTSDLWPLWRSCFASHLLQAADAGVQELLLARFHRQNSGALFDVYSLLLLSSSLVSSSFPAAPSSAGAFRSPCTATPSAPRSCPSEQEEARRHSMRQKLAPLFLLPTSQVPSSPQPQTCNSEMATWRPQITSSTVSLSTELSYFGRSRCATPHLSICYAAPPHRSRAGDGSSAGKGRGGAVA